MSERTRNLIYAGAVVGNVLGAIALIYIWTMS